MDRIKKDDNNSLMKLSSPLIYGVIGVCGVVGNLVARVLLDHDLNVMCTDFKSGNQCRYKYTLNDYNLTSYFGGHPEIFFRESDYIIPPPSLSKKSNLYNKVKNSGSIVLEVDDVLNMIKPNKPVLCITGTNGKTTTTNLLKSICYYAGLTPTEHGFKELQGNIEYIPPLQCRLHGDVAILETGTFGVPGDLKFILERSEASCGLITNITPDHMPNHQDFLGYANIKGEFVEYFKDKLLIINADDPTVMGLINNYSSLITGNLITFGVDYENTVESKKLCWCGREIILDETISGMGYYQCECGLKRSQPDYLATDIEKDGFILLTPENKVFKVNTSIIGLHNIYNILAAITAAIEFLDIPINQIIAGVKCFKGVSGRLDYVGKSRGKEVIIDYAHNPGGVETVLRELRKIYGQIAVVITVSSESGESGDVNILNKCLENADFIIPASFYSRKAADKKEFRESEKIILTTENPQEFKNGTLGANLEQVINGLVKALDCDVPAVVCIGEASFKYKEDIYKNLLQLL